MIRLRTVLRLILYVALNWIVLAALYAGLPTFSRPDNGTNYATSVLQSGGKLTRVYGTDDYFNEHDAVDFPGNNEQRISLALTFQVDAKSNKLIISDMGEVSLTKPAKWTPENQLENEEDDDDIFLLENPIVVSAPAGDDDGVNLPWFDTADAVLMYNFIHRDYASVRLRVAWRENGQKVEVWPDAGTTQALAHDYTPLLSLTLNSDENSPGPRIAAASVPPPPLSLSPSVTYHIRLTLLVVLAPLTLLIMGIFFFTSSIISIALSFLSQFLWVAVFVLVVRWLYKGRPPVGEFLQEIADHGKAVSERARQSLSGLSSGGRNDEEHITFQDGNLSLENERKA